MPATSARIYRERGRSVSRSYRGLSSRSRRYRRRESPVFRNVNVPAGAPLYGLTTAISARTCNWDNAFSLSFFPSFLVLSLSSHLFFSFSFDRSCCSRYARRFYYRLLTTRSVTYPRECILDFAKRGLSSERFYPLQRPRNGLTLCGPRTM